MSCPNCDHTMERINAVGSSSSWYWCPRCGTIREERTDYTTDVSTPKLVERCRVFEKLLGRSDYTKEWHHIGIDESINLPENRP